MRAIFAFLLVVLPLAGCNTAPPDPIRGSLTYGRTVRVPARAGYTVKHEFPDKFGYRVYERYVVQPDGTLKLISRRTGSDYWHFPRMR